MRWLARWSLARSALWSRGRALQHAKERAGPLAEASYGALLWVLIVVNFIHACPRCCGSIQLLVSNCRESIGRHYYRCSATKFEAEEREERQKSTSEVNGQGGFKISRQAPKIPRKYNKTGKNVAATEIMEKSTSASMEQALKPRGRAGSKNAPAKKQEKPTLASEDDDEVESLKDRLYDSSPEQTTEWGSFVSTLAAMDTDVSQIPARKEPTKRAAAQKTTMTVVSEPTVVPARARSQRANRRQTKSGNLD
ncbi:hypothetical protein GH714_036276 [Hevea brasiliensis]|uniref:Uncharacterized protein n=1 Tax=Hevea brasiliensis TaxID=3981 RepID=A0A6A6KDG3_HEVBR|nr:hypothetical protein GH714_036276 [Hevea brasiliensis]